jgi:hypothetical protein
MTWLREPLVHFLLIGAALFGIFALWGGPAVPPPGQYQIILTPEIIQNLDLSFTRAARRPPTPAEHAGLVDTYIREEILDREARALGLDLNDTLVRRQLSDKMEFYLQDTATPPQPTDAQLQDYLDQHAAEFRRPGGVHPTLIMDRPAVLAAWLNDQRILAADAAYQKLLAKYHVTIEPPPASSPSPSNTTAVPAK